MKYIFDYKHRLPLWNLQKNNKKQQKNKTKKKTKKNKTNGNILLA